MTKQRYTFDEPKSIDNARDRLDVLIADSQSIEAQLANPVHRDPRTGALLTEKEYSQWRYSALTALNIKRAEQRYLKRWIHEALVEKEKARMTWVYTTTERKLLYELMRSMQALLAMAGDEVVEAFDDATLEAVKHYLKEA